MLGIPRVGNWANNDVIAELKVAKDVKNIYFDGGNMTNVMGDPKWKDFLASWQYFLFCLTRISFSFQTLISNCF